MERSFTWQGRQMASAGLNGTAVTYKYNADGLRTYKKVGSTVSEYEYLGDKLIYEKRGNLQFHYRYDAYGNLGSITRINAAGSSYTAYVICNSRGDVEEIRKADGTLYARYIYDSWGNTVKILDANGNTVTDPDYLSVQNPIRYRGYYWDSESGLYYLQSRYYDPVTGRFVNGDKFVSTGQGVLGYNMYLYCNNNPVMYSDNSGDFPWLALFTIAATTILGGIIGYNSDIKISKKEKNDNKQTLINKVPEITKNVINQTNQGTQFEKIDAKKTYNKNNIPKKEDVELTKKDRVENALIGASIGLFTGGTLATVAGVVGSVVVGSAWVNIGIFGGTGAQTAATGALAYNFFAIIIAPALGIELEPIEFES